MSQPYQQRFTDLAQIAASKGLIKLVPPSVFRLLNFALYPYISTRQFYERLTQVTRVWQKLTFMASQDRQFLSSMAEELADMDPWGSFISKIYNGVNLVNHKNLLIFQRYDFITQAQTNQPKILEYNFMSVGLSFFTKVISESHRMFYPQESKLYLQANGSKQFINAICSHYKARKLNGKFLIVVGNNEQRVFSQVRYFETQLLTEGIKVQRVKFKQLNSNMRMDENKNLFYKEQLISFLLFRHGYNLDHFQQISIENGIKLKTMIANSNATSIPSIQYQLLNMKRVQCQLSKQQIMHKYLTEEEAKILQTSLVQSRQFNKMTKQQQAKTLEKIKQNPKNWVLKPNRQGGSNNIFGDKIPAFLDKASESDLSQYIYQQKIISPVYQNHIITENCILRPTRCFYELGRFGIISIINGEKTLNYDCGYSAYTHDENGQQAWITGSGAIDGFTSWKIQEE